MARPQKKGLDYFPWLTTTYNDRKVRRLMRAEGLEGVAIWNYLLCQIYANGYEITADEDFIFDVAEDLRIEEVRLTKVINTAIQHKLFSSRLYEDYHKLSSAGIQKQFIKICEDAKRKYQIDANLSLISSEVTPVSPEVTPEKLEESTQRKEKKSKVKERKEKESISPSRFGNIIAKIIAKDRPYRLDSTESEASQRILNALVSALESRKEVASLDNTVNLFCLIYESLSEIDRQNFTLVYLDKHLNRIFATLKVYLRKQSRRR